MCRLILVAPVCAVVSRGHCGWTFAQDAEQLHLRHRKQRKWMGGCRYQVHGSDHFPRAQQRRSRARTPFQLGPPPRSVHGFRNPVKPRSPALGLLQGIIPGVVDGTFHMQDLADTYKPH